MRNDILIKEASKIPQIEEQLNNIESKKATKQEVEVERQRINTITSLPNGSTTGDAELIDGRIGADTIIYKNIGSAIREQVLSAKKTNLLNENDTTFTLIEGGQIDSKNSGIEIQSMSVNSIKFKNPTGGVNPQGVSSVNNKINISDLKTKLCISFNVVSDTTLALTTIIGGKWYNETSLVANEMKTINFEIPKSFMDTNSNTIDLSAFFIKFALVNAGTVSITNLKVNKDSEIKSVKDITNGLTQCKVDIDNIKNIINNGNSELESYWETELNNKIATIKSNEEKGTLQNTLSFAFITDMHYPYNFRKSTKLLKHLVDNTNINYILNGGDSIDNSSSNVYENTDAVKMLYEMRKDFKKYGLDEYTLNTLGNHDLNTFGGKDLTAMQLYDSIYKTRANYTNVGGWCFYYQDDVLNKIRFIQLSTYGCNQQQLQWFCNALEVPSDEWGIVILSHALPYVDEALQNYLTRNSQYIKTIIDGYVERTQVAINDVSTSWGININKSFVNSKGSIICFLAGHVHVDSIKTDVINYVTTVNDSKDNDSFTKVEDTITEQTFDVLTVCKNTRTVYITRIGQGGNRQFTY